MKKNDDTARIYRSNDGDWRWQVRSANGEILADSGEGYTELSHTKDMVERLFPKMDWVVEDDHPEVGQ